MKLRVPVVNAFVKEGAGGNPAGVVLDASELTDKQMQAVAAQVGASETAFILPSDTGTHELRFFTPTMEVSLCGHATVASWSLMNQQGLHGPGSYTQSTKAGTVEITISQDGLIFMQQPPQKFGKLIDPSFVTKALGVSLDDLDNSFKLQIVQGDLMVCLKSDEVLNAMKPDLEYMKILYKEQGIDCFHVFVYVGKELLAKVRSFCPGLGINEDAATGTANGSLLAYLKQLNKLPDQELHQIEQGVAMGRPSLIYAKFHNDRAWVGGTGLISKEITVDV